MIIILTVVGNSGILSLVVLWCIYFSKETTKYTWRFRTRFANTVETDEVAHNELSHLDPHCLPLSLCILNMI